MKTIRVSIRNMEFFETELEVEDDFNPADSSQWEGVRMEVNSEDHMNDSTATLDGMMEITNVEVKP